MDTKRVGDKLQNKLPLRDAKFSNFEILGIYFIRRRYGGLN